MSFLNKKEREAAKEAKIQDEKNQKHISVLREAIIKAVDELYKLDIPIGIMENFADDLFKNYRRIKCSATKQWDVYIKENTKVETAFYETSCKDLVPTPYEPNK